MKLPYSWLGDFVSLNMSVKEYTDRMTMTGSKVEGYASPADEIDRVVCGRILSIKQHPNADKLVVCEVDVGTEVVQILTGATNLKVGDLVPAALDNSRLPGGVSINKTKMRGLDSFGMLCSIGELNLTLHDVPYAEPDGILVLQEEGALPGDDIRKVLRLDDTIIEFEITPNRPDCLSIIGLARESAVSFNQPFHIPAPQVKQTQDDILQYLSVSIEASDLCPRYTAAMVKDIRIAPSPAWMRARLRDAGVRPINNIVDITNYVMLEYGQPMHAFDYSCINGNQIIVRRSRNGEQTTTLDGQARTLRPDTLLISDQEKAVGIAGVMGGENSEITQNTKMIVFESAVFDGMSIRLTSRGLGMRTEASNRFEKNLDCENTLPAVLRACQLVEELGAGTVIGGVIDCYPSRKAPRTIPLEPERICRFIGADIKEEFMVDTLRSLGFLVNGRTITVPSWRDDAEGFADISEEIARMYGYDKVPSTLFASAGAMGGRNPRQKFEVELHFSARAAGFSEIKTLTFIGEKAFDKMLLPSDSPLRCALPILNPLGEDQSLLRTTPIPSVLEASARNLSYRISEVRLFELAAVYIPKRTEDGKADSSQLPDEKSILTMTYYGTGDFFTMKGALDSILSALSLPACRYEPCSDIPWCHPGRCAIVKSGNTVLGYVAQAHPQVLKNYGIGTELYLAELDVSLLMECAIIEKTYLPLPRFPAVTRDLALVCDQKTYALELEDVMRKQARKLLEDIQVFDVYQGTQLPAGKKSIAFSLTFRASDHTLTDQEIDASLSAILVNLEKECGAMLRG